VTCDQGESTVLIEALANDTKLTQTVMITAAAGTSWSSGTFVVASRTSPVLVVPEHVSVTAPGTGQFTVSASDPTGLPVSLSAAALPPGSSFKKATGAKSGSTGTFEWAVGPQDVGVYIVSVTATNSANVSTTQLVPVQVLASGLQPSAIVNAASYATNAICSAGSFASIFGSGFTGGVVQSASSVPLPTQLADAVLDIDGSAAPLLYSSDQLINFECPNSGPGTPMIIVIKGPKGATGKVEFTQQEASPGIFSTNQSGQGQGVVLVGGTPLIAGPAGPHSRPAQVGEYIEVFATGLGPTESVIAPGHAAPLTKLIHALRQVSLTIGGEQVVPEFAGLAPGFVGLWQINAKLPDDITRGVAVPLEVNVTLSNGQIVTSNIVTIAIDPSK
jgi:uncharacterized protein (TIGR03437 family)